MPDYEDQQDFAEGIIDSTLDTLRDQGDNAQKETLKGSVTFSSTSFTKKNLSLEVDLASVPRYMQDIIAAQLQYNRHLVLGPISFQTQFSTPPVIAFGQVGPSLPDGAQGIGIATPYLPFLVQPYVFRYDFTNGQVAGFYVGLYALTQPPTSPTEHQLSWIAVGEASRYGPVQESEAWTESYDQNEADFLTVDNDVEYDGD